jgi:hypothetical protein
MTAPDGECIFLARQEVSSIFSTHLPGSRSIHAANTDLASVSMSLGEQSKRKGF